MASTKRLRGGLCKQEKGIASRLEAIALRLEAIAIRFERIFQVASLWCFLQGKGTDFLFIEGQGIQRDGGLYNDDDGREYPD